MYITNYYVLVQTQIRSWGSENKSWQGGKECGWGQGPKWAVTVAAAAAAQTTTIAEQQRQLQHDNDDDCSGGSNRGREMSAARGFHGLPIVIPAIKRLRYQLLILLGQKGGSRILSGCGFRCFISGF